VVCAICRVLGCWSVDRRDGFIAVGIRQYRIAHLSAFRELVNCLFTVRVVYGCTSPSLEYALYFNGVFVFMVLTALNFVISIRQIE
jgi:hypothetical protein